MLRVLYGLILSAHPEYFRQRFGEEMQCIFDHAESDRVAIGLVADAVISLTRQWTLRPHFREQPPLAVAGQGGQLFRSLESNKPRTAALVYGAFLSVLVLNGVCWTMGYAWNHPIFIEWRQPVIVPPASWKIKTQDSTRPEASPEVEPELYTDEGRVVLIFNAHPRAAAKADPVPNSSVTAPTAQSSPENPLEASSNPSANTSAGRLQSYAGSYISNSAGHERVNVAVVDGRLQLEVVGQFSSPLSPLSNSQQLACGGADCRVSFSANPSGGVEQIEVHYSGRDIQAFRLRGAVF